MTTETSETVRPSFLGIEVHGDIIGHDERANQRPIEDLAPTIQAMFDDEAVIEFGWEQYTPYFNDGDPCIFRIRSPWVRLTTDPEGLEGYELHIEERGDTIGHRPVLDWRTNTYGPYEGPDEARYDRLHAFDAALQGGEFEDVLLRTFGDHAEVTVRRDGIQVDFYSHD